VTLDAAAVARLAALARIRVDDPEARAEELSRVLAYVAQLADFDRRSGADGGPAAREIAACPRRPDAPVPAGAAALVSASAGAAGAFVTVPRVVDRESA
jgi:Asp-tRNA(Asn)/Glu-tRNA(Gln) amidotransferase C subunit